MPVLRPFLETISKTLETVFSNLLEGALLVTVVLYLFSPISGGGIVASVIPWPARYLHRPLLVGIPANLCPWAPWTSGIIVDGAVIVIENIFRRVGDRASRATTTNAPPEHPGGGGRNRPADPFP